MNRPEGITQDAWDEANEIAAEWQMPGGEDHDKLTEQIARAIQRAVEAERERCAELADEMRRKHGSPSGDAYDNGLWDQGVRIAQMIRKGA